MCYRQHFIRKEELDDERIEFTKKLASQHMVGRGMVYFDEASVNTFDYKRRGYSKPNEPVFVPIN